MMVDLNLVATHPYLLLSHLQPNLAGKRAPTSIENMSGKFQSLVTLTKKFNKPNQHVAIVCAAGQTTDLVESVLSDRALRISRYSRPPQQKIYKKEIMKRRGATFHLMPSQLSDLRAAVYHPFDVVIVLDNTFDPYGKYGTGLRAQLRDPTLRPPYAPIVRLVALNSAQHTELDPQLNFNEQIAATVVLKKNAGAMPSVVKQCYAQDLSPLTTFTNDPDGPYPLPGLPVVKRVGHREVEKALYLDDEDQYQVDFANRRTGGRRKRANAEADDFDTGDDDSGSDSGNGNALGDAVNVQTNGDQAPIGSVVTPKLPTKRRRIELEDETVSICNELSKENPLSARLLVEFNDVLNEYRLETDEVSSHRELASGREMLIEKQREHMQQLALRILDIEKHKEQTVRRSEKLSVRNEKLEHEIQDVGSWWDKVAEKLSLSTDEAGRHKAFAEKIAELQAANESHEKAIESEKAKYQRLQSVADASSGYADSVTKERDALTEQVADLKSKLEVEPLVKEQAASEQISIKESEIKALKAELDNLKESVNIQLSSEKPAGRTDRRWGGRGGRGSGLNKHLHSS